LSSQNWSLLELFAAVSHLHPPHCSNWLKWVISCAGVTLSAQTLNAWALVWMLGETASQSKLCFVDWWKQTMRESWQISWHLERQKHDGRLSAVFSTSSERDLLICLRNVSLPNILSYHHTEVISTAFLCICFKRLAVINLFPFTSRKVMAAHRELENLRRSSKTSRSSLRWGFLSNCPDLTVTTWV